MSDPILFSFFFKELSEAVANLGIEVILDDGRVMEYPTDQDNTKLAYSGYWGQALRNHCGPRAVRTPW